jgi:hypothetical protein
MDKTKFAEMLGTMGIEVSNIDSISIKDVEAFLKETAMSNELEANVDETTTVTNEGETTMRTTREKLVSGTSAVLSSTAIGVAIGADVTKNALVKGAKESSKFTKEVAVPVVKDIGKATKESFRSKWAQYKARK